MVEKTIRLTGSSPNGIEAAVSMAVSRASVTIDGLKRARILDVRTELDGGTVTRWVVDLDVTFEVREDIHG